MTVVYCFDVAQARDLTVVCCDSCHDDADLGYDDLPERDLDDETIARVCCAVVRAMNDDEETDR